MTPYDWLNKFCCCYMALVGDIVSRCGLSSDVPYTNQPSKSKLVLYKPLICIYSCLKQSYTCNKLTHFGHKGGCGVYVVCISCLKELAWTTDKRSWVICLIGAYGKLSDTGSGAVWLSRISGMKWNGGVIQVIKMFDHAILLLWGMNYYFGRTTSSTCDCHMQGLPNILLLIIKAA